MPRQKRYFGWAGPEPADWRDHLYAVSPLVLKALPPFVDLRPRFKTPPFNQGALGSCGPQSAAGDLLFDEEQTAAPDLMPSRLQIYYHTRLLMGTLNQDSGVMNRDLCKALNQFGWAREELWPYDIGKFRQFPTVEAIADAATRKVSRYERVEQNLKTMQGAIAQGDPFIYGFQVYSNYTQAETTGLWPMPAGQVVGGHDVLICGYDNAKQAFLFRNSWGTNWGEGGYGWMPYAYATNQQLASDFWTLHWDEAPVPEPPVPPVPPVPPDPVPPGPVPVPVLRRYRLAGTNLVIDSTALEPWPGPGQSEHPGCS